MTRAGECLLSLMLYLNNKGIIHRAWSHFKPSKTETIELNNAFWAVAQRNNVSLVLNHCVTQTFLPKLHWSLANDKIEACSVMLMNISWNITRQLPPLSIPFRGWVAVSITEGENGIKMVRRQSWGPLGCPSEAGSKVEQMVRLGLCVERIMCP